VWVCKLVTIIEVEEEVSGGPIVVIVVVAGISRHILHTSSFFPINLRPHKNRRV
jgi:hypothetical protein